MNRRFRWPDERLIKAAQNGDVTSLTTVVMESQPHVRKFALTLCASPQDAEDAAQEALIILYRKIGTLRATGALASWMFRIVRNECLRQARLFVSRSDEAAAEPEAGAQPSAEDAVLRRLEAERIAAAVSGLPHDQRQVLIMRDVQGLPGHVVARSLGLSNSAMKSRLHRARAALRHSLAQTDQAPEQASGQAPGPTPDQTSDRAVGRPVGGGP
ncbi:RNA polymerase sigma-70 factor (ECF subfamily) [Streptomyces griseochromogenes]|uniref:RNA polymerase sigma-70 factor (ECF subfamily) n=1 Tax=Streptomyces griseochromogenes TaxID=68214 RepID=A0A1B1AWW6_9ACTN|nr:RNA polymerase sigma factor [Streptomyces griseochromogenes]ANP51022.1 RNA polymerase subunit sigma-24 [Streptomyces griseochromogenes]MBP2052047.1 RNA polymerase sigma-70 factor (ECF subfamily) [Streptomyces griseochromogenes]